MSFRLVPKSVTLNDLERRNGVILHYFSEFGQLPGALRKSSRSLSHPLMSSCYRIVSYRTARVDNGVMLTQQAAVMVVRNGSSDGSDRLGREHPVLGVSVQRCSASARQLRPSLADAVEPSLLSPWLHVHNVLWFPRLPVTSSMWIIFSSQLYKQTDLRDQWSISIKMLYLYYVQLTYHLMPNMPQKYCRKFEPLEQGARTLQTTDRRTGDSIQRT